MKIFIMLCVSFLSTELLSCKSHGSDDKPSSKSASLTGTWRLINGTLIEKGDTTVTDYTNKLSCIKIITPTHFAFFQHDMNKGKDSAVFVSGGGRVIITDTLYTEYLDYCNAREWEGNHFSFTMSFQGDTLIQRGVERIESAGVDRLNIERYVRVKQ